MEKYADIQKMVLDKFRLIRSKIKKGSKYRNIERLVSITTYFCLKLRNVSINPYELVEVSEITKKEFNDLCSCKEKVSVSKLGLLDCLAEVQEEVAEDGRVEIVFGDVVSVFNANEKLDNYFFALKGTGRTAVVISVKANDDPLNYKLENSYKTHSDPLIEFGLYRYSSVKDPPTIGA